MNWPLALGGLALLMVFRTDGGSKTDEHTMPHAWLLVANQYDQSLSIVDPVAGKEVGKVKTRGIKGHEVIASPDGRLAYVPIYGDSGVGQPGSNGQTIEVIQKFSDTPLAVHDKCGGAVERLISPSALKFKGSGWYVTDYAGSGNGKSQSSKDGNKDGGKDSSKGGKKDSSKDRSPAKDASITRRAAMSKAPSRSASSVRPRAASNVRSRSSMTTPSRRRRASRVSSVQTDSASRSRWMFVSSPR